MSHQGKEMRVCDLKMSNSQQTIKNVLIIGIIIGIVFGFFSGLVFSNLFGKSTQERAVEQTLQNLGLPNKFCGINNAEYKCSKILYSHNRTAFQCELRCILGEFIDLHEGDPPVSLFCLEKSIPDCIAHALNKTEYHGEIPYRVV